MLSNLASSAILLVFCRTPDSMFVESRGVRINKYLQYPAVDLDLLIILEAGRQARPL